MELIERIPLAKTEFILSLKLSELEPYFNKCKTQKEKNLEAEKIRSFCLTNRKTNGETKRIYSKPKGCKVDNRLYSGGSIQSLPKAFRSFFMAYSTTDIDMVNCHPVILSYVCKLHNISCPKLYEYVKNRDKILGQFSDRNEGKTAFLCSVNCDKINGKISNKFFKDFDKEMKGIHSQLLELEDYAEIVNSVPINKEYNKNGSAINRILCGYENRILHEALHIINKNEIEPAVLMFDGLMVYGDVDEAIISEIENEVEKKFPHLNMKWSVKDQECEIEMPEDFVIGDIKREPAKEQQDLFMSMCAEFEKTHCKIVNENVYVKEIDENVKIMSKDTLRGAYQHMSCGVDNFGNPIGFIDKWMTCNDKIRRFDEMNIFPIMDNCPANCYNMWKPFRASKLPEIEISEKIRDGITAILNHLLILCDKNTEHYEYLLNWIGQMVQYPERKSICITLISSEGAGKGTLLYLLRQLLGTKKVLETSDPVRDVFGNFNGLMKDAFLVNFSEVGRADMTAGRGKLKAIITDPTLVINEKGVKTYEIKSYHRCLITTNKEEPIDVGKDTRRDVIFRCSDELIKNKEYFDKLRVALDDDEIIRGFYDSLMMLDGLDNFNKIPLPKSEHQQNLSELSVPIPVQFLKDWTLQHYDCEVRIFELTSHQIYDLFSTWRETNKIKYEVNMLQLMTRVSNARITGISKRKTTKTMFSVFSVDEMAKFFEIGGDLDI